jgi:hypothetical protein
MNGSRLVCAVVVGLLMIGGPLAAMAQMVQPPPPPPAVVPPPREPGTAAEVGAGFLNVVYVPGKVIVCSAGTVASAGLMLLTFGSAYPAAVSIFKEGCGGHWVLTGYDVAGLRTPDE